MVDSLVSHLGDNFTLINNKTKNRLQVYRKYDFGIDPETYVELVEYEDKYHLSLVQRNDKFKKAEFSQKRDALFVSGIYAIGKMEDPTRNEQVQKAILNLKPAELSVLDHLLVQEVGVQYYSIMQQKVKVINLEQANDSDVFNIYYLADVTAEKKYLITNRKAPNAFLVLYNSAIKLKNAHTMILKGNEFFMVSQEQIELAKQLYLGIK